VLIWVFTMAKTKLGRDGRFARALKNNQLTSGDLPAISGTGH
jgi:hypothetical protein